MNPVDENVVILYHFDDKGRRRARQLENIFKLVSIRTVVGENLRGQEISLAVRERIEASTLVVGLLTRDVQIDENKWQPSLWIVQEITWAIAHGIPVLLAVEQGVVFNGGLIGNIEQIFFGDDFTSAASRIVEQAQAMMTSVIVPQELPELTLDDQVSILIDQARECGRKRRWKDVKLLSEQVLQLDPKQWRAQMNYALACVKQGLLKTAKRIFLQMLKDFADNEEALAAIYHNCAWVEEMRGAGRDMKSLKKQSRYYEKSLSFDASRTHTRASLVLCKALMREKDAAEALLYESLNYNDFLDVLRFEVDNRGWLGHEALRELPAWVYLALFPTRDSNDDKEFSIWGSNNSNAFSTRDSNNYDESFPVLNETAYAGNKNRNKEIKMKTRIVQKITTTALTLLTIALMVVGVSAASGQMG